MVPIGEPLDGREPPEPPACVDPENPEEPNLLFFSFSPARIAEAKALCARCPYREPCLEEALKLPGITYQGTGVWGGTDHRERAAMLRARGAVDRIEHRSAN
ncbi:MAG: Transcription factor WhiB [Actinomycetota bacterium]|jgi:WhiB family redox-sensing transcriptional regulator